LEPDKKRLTEEDRAQMKALERIDELIIVQNNHYMLGKYDDAINVAEDIIDIANEHNLMELVQEQQDYIKKMHDAKDKAKRLAALKELSEMKKQKVLALLDSGEILKAHELVEEFKQEYGKEFNLNKIVPARAFISKEAELWSEFSEKQDSIKEELGMLEKLVVKAKKEEDLKALTGILDQAKPLIPNLIDQILIEKWEKIEQEYSEIQNSINDQISMYEQKVIEFKEASKFKSAINYCEKIIKNAQKSGKEEMETKFTEMLEKLQDQLKIYDSERENQLKEIQDKAKQLEGALTIEEDTLPLIEEYSVNDLLGDLNSDINETLEKIGNLLNDHRVEIKKQISNIAILRSASGEVIELDKEIEVSENDDEPSNYSVQSGFSNPLDEIIEDGILTDLIPYNFEIIQVSYNGNLVAELPDKKLTKNGLEINWKLENIKPRENVEVNYDLRRRVSRTIIFILESQLKIIKTHSNLHSLDIEGSYDVKFPFKNSFGSILDGVVVEDIIPLYYLHFIKEPTRILPAPTISSNMGDLVKWNIDKMESETLNYHYRLLEIYRLEEIKIKIEELDTKGAEEIFEGRIPNALQHYQQIKEIISDYLK